MFRANQANVPGIGSIARTRAPAARVARSPTLVLDSSILPGALIVIPASSVRSQGFQP
jgi:hypothetical protein